MEEAREHELATHLKLASQDHRAILSRENARLTAEFIPHMLLNYTESIMLALMEVLLGSATVVGETVKRDTNRYQNKTLMIDGLEFRSTHVAPDVINRLQVL